MTNKFICVFFIIFNFISMNHAQIGQTGSIKGTIYDTNGSPKSEVKVTLQSPVMVLQELITYTNTKGFYIFSNLSPGEYRLTIESYGFTPIRQNGIVISANRSITLDMQFRWNNSKEVIVIEKGSPNIDRYSVTNVSTMDTEFFKSLPKLPTLLSYFLMVPGLTGETKSQAFRVGISSLGGTAFDNIYNLDGVNVTDPALGIKFFNYSMDIIDEMSIKTSGIGADQPGGRGAIINIITKSGGNRYSGSLAYYFTNRTFQADNTFGTSLEGNDSNRYNTQEFNINLQGPIVKNKLWISSNFNTYLSQSYLPGFPYDKEKEIPIKNNRYLPFFKLTFHPQQRDKIILIYNPYREKHNHLGASPHTNEEVTRKSYTNALSLTADWNHYFRDNFYSNIKVGYFGNNYAYLTKNDKGWGFEELTQREFGNGAYDDIYSRSRIQLNMDSTLILNNLLGVHELKFGSQFSWVRNQKKVVPKFDAKDAIGIPRFRTYWNGGTPYRGSFYIGFDKKENLDNIGFYINDNWSISKKLTLNLGLRFDLQELIFPAQNNDQYQSQGNLSHIGFPNLSWDFNILKSMTLFSWATWDPRLGFIYAINKNGRVLLKGNYSRYHQRVFTTYFFNLAPINWTGYDAILNTDGSTAYVIGTYIPGTDKAGYKNHPLKSPYTDEMTLGLEVEPCENWWISFRFIRRWDKNLFETIDANSLDIQKLFQEGELKWLNWEPITTIDPYDGKTITFWNQKESRSRDLYIINPPGAERNYQGLEIQIKKRFAKNWMLYFSYTYGKSEGLIGNTPLELSLGTKLYENPNAHINAYGRMPMEIRHQFRSSGLFKGPLGINFSGYFRLFSGFTYTRFIRSSDLGINLFQGTETIMAEPRGSRLLPHQIVLDLRLEKIFRVRNITIRLFADLFNIFNNNKATYVEEISSNPNLIFEEMKDIMSPRTLRFGAKIQFN